jgi:hypothetical protein
MNLHALPAGTHMYTAYVTTDPEGTPRDEMGADEIDITAPAGSSWGVVVNDGLIHDTIVDDAETRANQYIPEAYGPDCRIVGVVDQSAGVVIYDAFAAGDETGE